MEELTSWENYLKKIIERRPHYGLYLKGGSVLALRCIQLLSGNREALDELAKLDLFNDWDFVLYSEECPIDDENMIKEGESLVVMRYKTPKERIMHNGESYIEMSIKNPKDGLSSLELPLSSMKLLVTMDNLANIFWIIKRVSGIDPRQITCNMIDRMHIEIDSHDSNGLFKINSIDNGKMSKRGQLSNEMLELMNSIGDSTSQEGGKNESGGSSVYQFLISQMIEPDRFFYRLANKNLMKANKIRELFVKYLPNHNVSWLPNERFIMLIQQKFMCKLKLTINDTHKKYKSQIDNLHDEIILLENKMEISNCEIKLLECNMHFALIVNILQERINTLIEKQTVNTNPSDIDILSQWSNLPLCISKLLMNGKLDSLCKAVDYYNELNEMCLKHKIYEKCNINPIEGILNRAEKLKLLMSDSKLLLKTKQNKIKMVSLHYSSLFSDLDKLFQGINMGRLRDKFSSFPIDRQNDIKYLFSGITKGIRSDIVKLNKNLVNTLVCNFILSLM